MTLNEFCPAYWVTAVLTGPEELQNPANGFEDYGAKRLGWASLKARRARAKWPSSLASLEPKIRGFRRLRDVV
ncbi:MAG: hypothetical protein CBC48_16365 [bacterium TMED88]|nr:MAG: hypothetical protein CBC48_16365 [bacterium TMED88]